MEASQAFISLSAVLVPLLFILLYTITIGSLEIASAFSALKLGNIPVLSKLDITADKISETIMNLLNRQDIAVRFTMVMSAIGSFFLHTLIVAAITYFMLIDGHKFSAYVQRVTRNDQTLFSFIRETDKDLKAVFFGNINTAIATMVLSIVTFNILNIFAPKGFAIPYPVLLGVLCAFGTFIPIIGIKLVWVPIIIFLSVKGFLLGRLSEIALYLFIFVILAIIVLDTIPDIIIRPFLSGAGRIPSGRLFFAYIFGPAIFGISGLLIGPMIVVLAKNFVEIVLPHLRETSEVGQVLSVLDDKHHTK